MAEKCPYCFSYDNKKSDIYISGTSAAVFFDCMNCGNTWKKEGVIKDCPQEYLDIADGLAQEEGK